MAHKIIGTAGHIDHGKSSLVRALTGTDPDRLAEEQDRGMTIDLGFAFLNQDLAFIDVPGHEKFIKNMVAGVTTVDMALLVVAADDGVMPQTREHLDILKILQLEHGLIALTKIDLVEREWLEIVEEDIRVLVHNTFLQHSPIIRVSSATGEGIENLRRAIIELARHTAPRQDRGVFWMPIDRSFTIKGHGTVVTGSVLSGHISVGESCELLPQRRSIRIRGIQKHGVSAETALPGDRAALNLMNIAKENIERGNILATPHHFYPAKIFDAKISLLDKTPKALSNRTRVRLHLGTREILARIKVLGADKIEPGGSAYVQLLLEQEAVAQKHDPFVIRRYSPQLTIGGGIILDTNPLPHKRMDKSVLTRLQKLETFEPVQVITSVLMQSQQPMTSAEIAQKAGFDRAVLEPILADLLEKKQIFTFGAKTRFLHKSNYDNVQEEMLSTLEVFHKKEPLRPGMKKANLLAQTAKNMPAVFEAALQTLEAQGKIVVSNDSVRLDSHEIKLSETVEALANDIYNILEQSGYATPPIKILAQMLARPQNDVQVGLNALLGLGKIVRFEGDIYFTKTAIDKAKEKLSELNGTEITVGEFRQLLNTSRKFAMPLLGYFDAIGVTERVGDSRLIKTD
ncbi:selenocysteine-specific translation elongation factor [candidate division KSB1 bacterium]|nr:selenocysteine-specific translation elongation factor [candidate division KSB1 bacterium]RQW00871.1 MAG: selenocysteine-specific translation elongation factor [candidate division KSB1 bacterium]